MIAKQRVHDDYVKNMLAEREGARPNKHWDDMNIAERKQRIRQLWAKVRIFVRLRRSLDSVKVDMERRELVEMMYQK